MVRNLLIIKMSEYCLFFRNEDICMNKIVSAIIITTILSLFGCKEQLVGAPCRPETDDGTFLADQLGASSKGTTWSIETGSVQCATNICLTQTKVNKDSPSSKVSACKDNPSTKNCWVTDEDNEEPPLLKFSFCTCRCEDAEGNRFEDNPDKFDDLCECPPSSICQKVLDPIEGVAEKLFGGYCVPACIAKPCINEGFENEICTPSKNSEEPWKWSCEKIID